MIDDHEQRERKNGDRFDRILDAVLAQYAGVEPRAGLEERVLANLYAAEREAPRTWPFWLAAVPVLALIVVAVLLALRPARRTHDVAIQNHPVTPRTERNIVGVKTTSNGASEQSLHPLPLHPKKSRTVATGAQWESLPKLDQFPSAQPLSEQEQILAMYVAHFHPQAVLLAEVHAEELRRDREEDARKWQTMDPKSEQLNPETTNQ